MAMFDALKSEDATEALNAVATVEANPGAYLPAIFGGVAREMMERGRTADAILWDQFGMFRMLEDMSLAGRFNGRADHMALMLTLSYQQDESAELKAAVRALSPSQRQALVHDIERMDARFRREYPLDWGLTGRDAYEKNFVATPTPWSADQKEALRLHHSEYVREFRDYITNLESNAAPEPEPERGAQP